MKIARYVGSPVSYSPWQELENASARLNRLFGMGLDGRAPHHWAPPVDVEETEEELMLASELPGMGIEDIEIEVKDNVLTLRGEKKEEKEEKENNRYHIRERAFGSFKRTFAIPRSVKTDEISAQFQDGILHIRLPKAAEAKSRKISIETEG